MSLTKETNIVNFNYNFSNNSFKYILLDLNFVLKIIFRSDSGVLKTNPSLAVMNEYIYLHPQLSQ